MKPLGNVMILASAGAGKTYALTNRYVGLLARGAEPDRIAALTFTRKAAGEFFDEILKKVAQAAASPAAARRLATEIGTPGVGQEDFRRMLRSVVDSMHRLTLGTLDGFFARVVRSFPMELGLGGEFEILEEYAARLERRRVLRRLFSRRGAGDPTARQDFLEAFKRATFGVEEKRLGARLDAFLDEHAEVYLAAPEAGLWGRPERIWPEGCEWTGAGDDRRRDAAIAKLRAALAWETFSDKQRARWEDFLAALPEWSPGATLPKPVDYLAGNAFDAWPELAEITVERKKVALSKEARDALRELLGNLVAAEFGRRLEMTQGVFAVLRGYEEVYDAAVRRSGRLTFSDLQRLLRPDVPGGAQMLTRDAAEEARLFIDWRLDAQIDHWLLDEFQDTSFGQWSVLRNLIDEAVQDESGTRSFFYVGDVKQAIFAWREGDSRLFREIFNHYNAAAPGAIGEEHLVRSYRSAPAIIGMVNRVMGDAAALRGLFPEGAAARWSAEWRDHESVRREPAGFAELRRAEGEEGRFAETLAILRETEALQRGLSVAVLVQKNDTAAALADYLRREGGLPAATESDLHFGTDNPLTCALLALCKAAAHPGDRAAWEHLRMTPIAGLVGAENGGGADAAVTRLLREINDGGFERFVRGWARRLEPSLEADDVFSRERARQLADAARLFDETGSRDVAEFVQFIERQTVREAESEGVVRVMTIHKSKGLGFDLVVLPDLEGTKLASRRRGLAVKRRRDRSVDWVLDLPGGMFLARDPVLTAFAEEAEADACYEGLALLYVAMTRAKKAMYLVVEPVGNSRSHNYARLLQETLGETWADGESDWYRKIEKAAPTTDVTVETDGSGADREFRPAVRRPAHTPSSERAGVVSGGRLFEIDASAAAEFGRIVHRLLAQVEWLEEGASGRWAESWSGEGEAGAAAARCVAAEALAAVWKRPERAGGWRSEVWRERSFEIVLDGAWVTGVFDRVVIEKDGAGRVAAATVFDFKTDSDAANGERVVARHAGQLNLYRRVASVLLGLPPEQVGCEVIFVRTCRRAGVPWRP